MKKNISINISGIIFHIEEDAFDQLKDYLDSINRYFSSFDDTQEIVADIESRIAEIFLGKLHDDKQVITIEDVESLKATMGSIRDFQAVEEEFEEENEPKQEKTREFENSESKKLYRDEKRKLLAGVCAGLAHYFNIDPLWIRLIFFILLIGSGGIILPVYIVMWAVVPANDKLPEDKKLKKMFRDPESKVVAGVSSGLANYFGVDVVIIRVLFVISLFIGGFGLLTYICLWIILPEAKSVSDKMQMKGDPITLTNIETNIKENLNVKENDEENIFVKLILFPFRLVATLIEALGKILGPFMKLFVDIIRVVIGASLVMAGVLSIISIVIALGAIIGIFSSDMANVSFFDLGNIGVPFDTMTNGLPAWTIAAAVLVSIIPLFFLILLGSSIIAKRITFSANTGWSLLAGFVISLIVLAVNVPMIAFNFSEEGDYTVKTEYALTDKVAVLKLNDIWNREYNVTTLKIRGYSGDNYLLEQVFEAQGSSRREAEDNARMVDYEVKQEDSILYFDSNISFKRDAVFRAQRLDMTLYIPYGAKFMMDEDLRDILRNTIYTNGYRVSDMEDNLWTFTTRGLECITCEGYDRFESSNNVFEEYSQESDNSRFRSYSSDRDYDRVMTFNPFDEIEIEGAFIVNIESSKEYKLLIDGREQFIDDLNIRQVADKLRISINDFDEDIPRWALSRDDIELTILVPEVKKLEITGACATYMTDFNQDRLDIELTGASSLKADLRIEDLEIDLKGASKVELKGRGDELRADVVGASHVDAYEYKVRYAQLQAEGVSSIKAYVTDEINMEESFISNIKYKWGARVNPRSR